MLSLSTITIVQNSQRVPKGKSVFNHIADNPRTGFCHLKGLEKKPERTRECHHINYGLNEVGASLDYKNNNDSAEQYGNPEPNGRRAEQCR
jgi:hypothetical protein